MVYKIVMVSWSQRDATTSVGENGYSFLKIYSVNQDAKKQTIDNSIKDLKLSKSVKSIFVLKILKINQPKQNETNAMMKTIMKIFLFFIIRPCKNVKHIIRKNRLLPLQPPTGFSL
jgi:hypothetical protein